MSQAAEFKDLRMKPNERSSFRELNKSPFIKAPIKENISTYVHKVSLMIQVQLGGVDLPSDKEFNIIRRQFLSETSMVFDRVKRLIRCVIECKAYDCDAVGTCNALELARSISAGYWENSTLQLRQIPNIGPAAVRKLVQSNVKTVAQVFSMDTAAIERALSRNPPCGRKMLDFLTDFPRLRLQANIVKKVIKAGDPVRVQCKAYLGFANAKVPYWLHKAPSLTFTAAVSTGILAHIWRGPIRKLEKGFEVAFTCELEGPNDVINCQLACEEIVGTVQFVQLKPEIPASSFPPPKPGSVVIEPKPKDDHTASSGGIGRQSDHATTTENVQGDIQASPGSDYGEELILDDFMDIDNLDHNLELHHKERNEKDDHIPEPVQMENGKWQCNHTCRSGQTKKGQPCRHLCCREGLEKPPKPTKKKVSSFIH